MRLILSANSSLLAHSRSVHIPAKSHVPPLPHTPVNLLETTCNPASAKNSSQLQSDIQPSVWPGFFFCEFDWLVYLGLWFPCHGLEQLVEVWPVALRIPSRLVQWRQPLAVLRVIHWKTGRTLKCKWAGTQTPAEPQQSPARTQRVCVKTLITSSASVAQVNKTSTHLSPCHRAEVPT